MSHHGSALEKVITRKINECWVAPPQEPSSCLSSGSNGGSNYVAGLASRSSCSALKYTGYLEYLINCIENSLTSNAGNRKGTIQLHVYTTRCDYSYTVLRLWGFPFLCCENTDKHVMSAELLLAAQKQLFCLL